MTKFAFGALFSRRQHCSARSFGTFPIPDAIRRLQTLSVRHVVHLRTRSAPTSDPSREPDRVGLVIGMPLRTMRLAPVDSKSTVSPQDVLYRSHSFKMFRVHTVAGATQVVNHKVIRDWTNEPLVHKSMNRLRFASHLGATVPIDIDRSLPEPAVRPNVAHNEPPETVPEQPVIEVRRQISAQHSPQRGHLRHQITADVHRIVHGGRCMTTTYGNQLTSSKDEG